MTNDGGLIESRLQNCTNQQLNANEMELSRENARLNCLRRKS